MGNNTQSFLEMHQEAMPTLGFWKEEFKTTVMIAITSQYKTEILREWFISDIVIVNDKVLCKWAKHIFPLNDQELKERYNRIIKK